ncbi:MAG: Gldg family protein [Bacteriovoracaceae bacterium]
MATIWTILFGVLFIVNVASWVILFEYREFNLGLSLALMIVGLIAAKLNQKKIQDFYQSQWFKNFSKKFIRVFICFGILGMLNYLVFKNSKTYDFSGRFVHGLPPQLQTLITSFKSPVEIKVFSPKKHFAVFQNYLKQFEEYGSEFQIEYIEPSLRPDLVEKFGVTSERMVWMKYGEKVVKLSKFTHQDFASGFHRLSREYELKVGFTTNHGEPSLESKEKTGLSALKGFLKSNGIQTKPINLLSGALTEKELGELDAIAIWGPKSAFSQDELSRLQNFLNQGKSLYIAIDPTLNADPNKDLRSWLAVNGIFIDNAFVIDKKSFVNGSKGSIPLVNSQWGAKDYMKLSFPVFFPLSAPVYTTPGFEANNKNLKVEPVLVSSHKPHSWSERSKEEFLKQDLKYTEGVDAEGPLAMMVLLKNEKTSILGVGSSRFVENQYARFSNHFELFYQGLNSLGPESTKIKLSNFVAKEEPIFIGQTHMKLVFSIVVIFLPLIFLGLSIYIYRRGIKAPQVA